MLTEILKYFIPQKQVQSKHRTYLIWERGPQSVEIQIPGTGIRKSGLREKRPWIVASFREPYKLKNGRTIYKNTTCSYEYDKIRLTSLLNELNRSHERNLG